MLLFPFLELTPKQSAFTRYGSYHHRSALDSRSTVARTAGISAIVRSRSYRWAFGLLISKERQPGSRSEAAFRSTYLLRLSRAACHGHGSCTVSGWVADAGVLRPVRERGSVRGGAGAGSLATGLPLSAAGGSSSLRAARRLAQDVPERKSGSRFLIVASGRPGSRIPGATASPESCSRASRGFPNTLTEIARIRAAIPMGGVGRNAAGCFASSMLGLMTDRPARIRAMGLRAVASCYKGNTP